MSDKISSYKITVDCREGPGMQWFVDLIAEALECRGLSDRDYDITVNGPPELRIGLVMR